MSKVLNIGWKDLTVIFRDRAALILMLAAPFALTLAMGFVTGRFSGKGSSGLSDIPVVIVNQDEGPLGSVLVETLTSEDLADLLEPTTTTDVSFARAQVDEDAVAAAVFIPASFTSSILPDPQTGKAGSPVSIEIYSSPGRPISAGLIQSIVEGFLSQVEVGLIGGQVAITQLVTRGLVSPQAALTLGQEIGTRLATGAGSMQLITLRTQQISGGEEPEFDSLAYLAPGMAILFLMYIVSLGGRSILTERDEGTLPRMLTTPTPASQVLGGKVLGVFLTGFAQMGILMLATSLLFNLRWGDPVALLALIVAVVAGAAGWGILLAAFARTPGQVSSVGMAMMLSFGILGGSFFSVSEAPNWLRVLGRITPNSWGLEGITSLARGATLGEILTPIGALLVMAIVLFSIAVVVFRRRGIA